MQENNSQRERYVKIGNHLAQHREMSLTAIGLSTHIQSLPDGADVSIKALSKRFSEGETRIAAALRELEAHGYLSRTRERLPSGQVVTRTVSYNVPLALLPDAPERTPAPAPVPARLLAPAPDLTPAPAPARAEAPAEEPDLEPDPAPDPDPGPGAGLEPGSEPAPGSGSGPGLAPAPGTAPEPAAPVTRRAEAAPLAAPGPVHVPAPALAPASAPTGPLPEEHREAAELLARLRLRDPRLMLSERDVARLAPSLTGWLKLGLSPAATSATLAGCLPDGPIRSPGALLAYRLRELRPPRLSERPVGVRPPKDREILPFQTCDDCDRAFRAASPGHCAPCTAAKAA